MNKDKTAEYFLRYSLAASYLSAVADRFGVWGQAGDSGVVWGNFNSFLEYTQYLNPWAPVALANVLGYIATILEIILPLLLIIGFKVRYASFASFLLLMLFALSMTLFSGIKGALDYSVFTAAAASFLLFVHCDKNA